MSKMQIVAAQELVVHAAEEMRTVTAVWMSPLLAPESRPRVLQSLHDAQQEYQICRENLIAVARHSHKKIPS